MIIILKSGIGDAAIDDVWDACTNPERIPRWFLPVSGDLRLGGRYLRVEPADDCAQLRLLVLGGRDLRPETRDLLVDLRSLVLGGVDLVRVMVRGHTWGDADEHRGDDERHHGFHQLHTLRNRRTPM